MRKKFLVLEGFGEAEVGSGLTAWSGPYQLNNCFLSGWCIGEVCRAAEEGWRE